jgi:signal transduction histidine kinase
MLLPVPLVALLAASLATAFAWGIDDPSARLATGVGLAAISALTWLGLFKVLITDPVLRPISDLTAAVDRVRADDLSTPVPLTTSDELGELAAAFNRMQDGLREREQLASDNVELVEELQASRLRIVEAGDRERRRVERDLHDGAQQRLVSVAVALRLLERHLPPDGESPAATLLEQASGHAEAAINEVRELARGIHPQVLTEEGLEAALASLAQRANLPVEVRTSLKRRLPTRVEAAAYFVCSEGLANVDKYADATQATLSAEEDGVLTVLVRDDGKGGATIDRGSGLRGLSDRVSALGGSLDVDSPAGGGTVLRVCIPVDEGREIAS